MKSQIPNPKSQINLKSRISKRVLNFGHWILEFVWKLEIGNWKFFKTVKFSQEGVALLPVILVLFGLVMVVGVAIAGISVSENTISSTKDASDEALAIAESGIQDALMKLARDKDYTSGGYNLSVSGGTATIVVPSGSPKNITSTGTLNNKSRKIQITVSVDANGKITQSAWTETAP